MPARKDGKKLTKKQMIDVMKELCFKCKEKSLYVTLGNTVQCTDCGACWTTKAYLTLIEERGQG